MPDSVQPRRRMTAAIYRRLYAEGRAPRIAGAETSNTGQGDSGATGVFDSYLQTVPEEHRETVTGYLRDAEKNVNGRLSEAAALKESWGGYEQHLAPFREQYDPETLAQILAWHQQVSTDQDAYQQWLKDQATQAGLIEGEPAASEEQGELTREEIQRLIDEQASQRLAPVQERLEQWETERAIGVEEQDIRSEFQRLEGENKVQLTKEQQAMVLDLGMAYQGDGSWVQAGFERLQAIFAEGQQMFVARAQNQPGSPLTAGGAAAVKPPTTFEDAGKLARERFRAAVGS
jgi:hypothetical protein